MSSKESHSVLIVGATGQQGGAVTEQLLTATTMDVYALTRSPESEAARRVSRAGATIVEGNLFDPDSLERALTGIDRVFCVTDYSNLDNYEREIRQGYNLIVAAENSSVDYILYSSAMDVNRTSSVPHFNSKQKIEQRLWDSELDGSVIRPAPYYQNFEYFKRLTRMGLLAFPISPRARIPMVDVDDIGAAAATILKNRREHNNEAYDLYGSLYDLTDIAEIATSVTGVKTTPVSIPTTAVRWLEDPSVAKMFDWFSKKGRSRNDSPPEIDITFTDLEKYFRRYGWGEPGFDTRIGNITHPIRKRLFAAEQG